MCVCVCVCEYLFIFIHSSISGHLGCFPILAIVNKAVMNISLHTSFLVSVFVFLGKIFRREFAKLYDSSIFNIKGNKNCIFLCLYFTSIIL